MSLAFKQTIENINALSSDEKALIAHCLISSLVSSLDDNVDTEWGKLSDQRYKELSSGNVEGLSWSEIRSIIKE